MTLCWVALSALSSLLWHAPAIAQTWPNEPANSTLITDWPFTTLTGGGWNHTGSATIVSDPTAPLSANNVGRFQYSSGFNGGSGPDNVYYSLPDATLYFGFWWKPSNPWQGHSSNVNKIQFLMGNGHDMYVNMHGPNGGPYHLEWDLQFPNVSNGHLPGYGDNPGTWVVSGNVNSTTITLGNWHRIEAIVSRSTSTSARNGILKWWLDGVLQGNYTNVNYPSTPFVEFQFAPTWGGTGDTKTQTDNYWFDHVRISRPNGSVTSITPPPNVSVR